MDGVFLQQATGEEIDAYIRELWPQIQGREMSVVVPSLIMVLLSAQDPEISQERLIEGVKEVSGFISMYLAGAGVAH
jgi:hypothetical protein